MQQVAQLHFGLTVYVLGILFKKCIYSLLYFRFVLFLLYSFFNIDLISYFCHHLHHFPPQLVLFSCLSPL